MSNTPDDPVRDLGLTPSSPFALTRSEDDLLLFHLQLDPMLLNLTGSEDEVRESLHGSLSRMLDRVFVQLRAEEAAK